jgi:hypothetical protein
VSGELNWIRCTYDAVIYPATDRIWGSARALGRGSLPGDGARTPGAYPFGVLGAPAGVPYATAVNACIRFRLQAMHTRSHSPAAARKPRNRNWRHPITALMIPNLGSIVVFVSRIGNVPVGF